MNIKQGQSYEAKQVRYYLQIRNQNEDIIHEYISPTPFHTVREGDLIWLLPWGMDNSPGHNYLKVKRVLHVFEPRGEIIENTMVVHAEPSDVPIVEKD